MTVHPRDELGGYALGTLDPTERRAVEAHLRTCASCRAELQGHGGTLWALAETAAADPPAGLRERIVARERKGRGFGSAVRELVAWQVPAYVPIALAITLAVLAAGLGFAVRDADAYAQAVAAIADARIVTLAPTAEAPNARGTLVLPQSGQPYVVVKLPAPPPGKAWEAWVIRGERAIPAGLAEARRGVLTVTIGQGLLSGDGVAVTLEDAAGAEQPTSPPVLAGRI